jgi:hypothetical protein
MMLIRGHMAREGDKVECPRCGRWFHPFPSDTPRDDDGANDCPKCGLTPDDWLDCDRDEVARDAG